MPTIKEQQELFDKCNWSWTEINGVKGYKVTGPNGNSILFLAAGIRGGSEVYRRGAGGSYWSASLYGGRSNYVYDLDFYSYNLYFGSHYNDWDYYYRDYGFSVRPVSE